MENDFETFGFFNDGADMQREVLEIKEISEVPRYLEVLPDGRETIVIGNPEECKEFNHHQGDNPLGFKGTCGLVSCEDILRQFGVEVTEAEVVQYAADHGLCSVTDTPEHSGGTSELNQAKILKDYGVPAHLESGADLDDLATWIEEGHGVIIEANAGELWGDPTYYDNGQANHAIVVTGVARDPDTGKIQGVYINDSGTGKSAQFVAADTIRAAWSSAGGLGVVTDSVRI